MTNFMLKITPYSTKLGEERHEDLRDDVELEVLFDDDRITLEMHDIFVDGSGMVTDPETQHLEVIQFRGPITTANIVLNPEEVIRERYGNHDMFPQFKVEEVKLQVDQQNTIVTAHGQTPLFKTKKFEDSLKKWLQQETSRSLIPQLKKHFIDIEKNIWTHIPFEYQGLGYKLVYGLSEKMKLTDDYIEIGVVSELHDVDHGEFKEQLRRVTPEFNENNEFKQDVQMIFDENLVNHALLALHYNTKVFSLREILMALIPEKYQYVMVFAQAMF